MEASEVEALRKQVKELDLDLQVASTRTELALTMPHVLKEEEPEPEAGKRGARSGGRGARQAAVVRRHHEGHARRMTADDRGAASA